jgi:PAS domain S-box-containing protein
MIDINQVIESSKDLTLLYVEDNADAREVTTMILEDFFASIVVAVDGVDALEKFNTNDIDVVITDINMPKLSGLELCSKIREVDNEVVLIVLSAHNQDGFFLDSIHIGVNGYLLKPIDIDQLLNVIFRSVEKYKYMKEAKENLHFLQIYQEVTNQSSIVSKTDKHGIIIYVNEAFCEITGYTKEELIGKNHNIVRHPDNPVSMFEDLWHTIKIEKKVWHSIVRNRNKSGKSYYVDTTIMPILNLDGEIIEYISLRHNVTDIMNPQRQLIDEIKHFNDPVLILIKLDKFEMMEEFYDHLTLKSIEEKVHKVLKDICARYYEFDSIYNLGSGEYAFLLDYKKYFDSEENFIKKLKECQEVIKKEKIKSEIIEYEISLLISLVYEKDKILESARLGMKQLLHLKKDFIVANGLAKVTSEIAKENMKTIGMIKKAIENSKIHSYFQPIVDNVTKKVVEYESLVRLIDEKENVITPSHFIETSKKSNYYSKITHIVLENSCRVLRETTFEISINLSMLDIEDTITREKIFNILEENSNYTDRLIFELLEDESMREFETVNEFIQKVKSYGVKIAIDNFGTSYFNYERLLKYQPDILKIDGCLIQGMQTSSYSLSAVKSIVTFAKEQHIKTVAKFVENEAIFNIVKELSIDYSQGYYFAKAEPL